MWEATGSTAVSIERAFEDDNLCKIIGGGGGQRECIMGDSEIANTN